MLSGLRTFPDGDFTHHFLPFSLFQQQEMLAGRLPIWNPYTYGGHPFLADVQAAVFYPISTLLLGLTLPWRDAGTRRTLLQLEAVVQVGLAVIFTFVLARQLTGSFWAGLLAGICFAFSGYLTGYPPAQLAVLRTAIWLPLLLWLLLRMVAEPRRWRWWIATGVAIAVTFLAGHSQTFLYVVYTAAAWAILLFVLRWRSLAVRERSLLAAAFLGSGLLALGFSAVQLLPSAEFAGLSVRANVDYAFVAGGFPLQDTWQLLLPAVLTQYSPLYIGVIGLGFAWLGIWFIFGRRSQASTGAVWTPSPWWSAVFFLALALLALLLSYGGNGSLYPLFYRFAPGWNLFRGQERVAYLVALGMQRAGRLRCVGQPGNAAAQSLLVGHSVCCHRNRRHLPVRPALAAAGPHSYRARPVSDCRGPDGDAGIGFRSAAAHTRLEPAALAVARGTGGGQPIRGQHGHKCWRL